MDYSNIYNSAYKAMLKALTETGDSYKGLSWFGRNKPEQPDFEKQD